MKDKPGIVTLVGGGGVYGGAVMRTFGSHPAADPAYGDFNLCHYTGDDDRHWQACREELQQALGKRLIVPTQTHSCRVAVIGDSPLPPLDGVDALVTRRQDVALVVNTADCLPVIFHASGARVIGIAHAGWRGLHGGILRATVEAMVHMGASPSGIHAVIGPAICGDCYEVDVDFARRFVADSATGSAYADTKRIILPHPVAGKARLDLKEAALQQLRALGVASAAASPHCTFCSPALWHSARHEGTASGRTATFVTFAATTAPTSLPPDNPDGFHKL